MGIRILWVYSGVSHFYGRYQVHFKCRTLRPKVLLAQQSMPDKEHASSFQANPMSLRGPLEA